MLYLFSTKDEAYRFLVEVLYEKEIFDFDYRYNYIEFPNGIEEEIEQKIFEYGGRKYRSN